MARRKNPFESWGHNPPRPEKLSRHTIKHDRYDMEDIESILRQMPDFDIAREKLVNSSAGDLGYDVYSDMFWALKKVDPKPFNPEDVRPTHQINRMVREEAEKLPDFKELRVWTTGDDISSGMACNTLEPDLETIYDKLDKEKKQAEDLEKLMSDLAAAQDEMRDLDEMFEDWTSEDEQRKKDLQDQIDDLMQQIQDGTKDLNQALNGQRPHIKAALRKAMGDANESQRAMNELADMTWGLEPGEIMRLPAERRLEMAKKMNNQKFRRIAEIFGSIKRLAMTEQRRRVDYAREEIYDVTLGGDLANVLPSELAKLGDPDREDLFYKDLLEKSLPQYALRGYERVAKGNIVYVHDGSGSMAGEREIFDKAIGLAFLHIARKQKREFYGIQFGNPGNFHIDDFRDIEHIDPEAVLTFAERFLNSGTDFATPLNHAVEILDDEFHRTGRIKGDIVFVTDGQCGVTDTWMTQFKEAQKRLGFKVYGIIIGGEPSAEPMNTICDGRVATVKSLVNGESVRDVFGAI